MDHQCTNDEKEKTDRLNELMDEVEKKAKESGHDLIMWKHHQTTDIYYSVCNNCNETFGIRISTLTPFGNLHSKCKGNDIQKNSEPCPAAPSLEERQKDIELRVKEVGHDPGPWGQIGESGRYLTKCRKCGRTATVSGRGAEHGLMLRERCDKQEEM